MGIGHVLCCVGGSCEGVDSNQWVPLQCKYCMIVDNVYFGNIDFFLNFIWSWPLCSHWLFNLTFGHSQMFKGISTYMWLGIWDNLHTLNARRLAYYDLHILAWEFVEMLNYRVFPTNGTLKSSTCFQDEFDWSKVFLGGIKCGIFMWIVSFDCYYLKKPKGCLCPFLPYYSSSPIFQDPTIKSHFNLTTCPWKIHNQYWAKCTQNNPFIGLGR